MRQMKLSDLDALPSFALLGPGFTGGSYLLLEDLRPGGELFFAAFEDEGPTGWAAGRRTSVELDFDMAPVDLRPVLDEVAHRVGIERVLSEIAAGELEQVNLTLRARLSAPSGAAVWATLCRRGVPRFASWVRLPDGVEFVSASPELFFEIRGDRINLEPMKGTAAPDRERELRESSKEVDELALVTEMVRRELEPLCVPGTVEVADGRRFVQLAYAVQAVSDVVGVLRPETSVEKVFEALHPGASIMGVPRDVAATIIAEEERTPRGAYCGALAWVRPGDEREVVCSMLIRTAFRKGPEWFYGVGGGITAGSDPDAELAELQVKLGALR